MLASPLLLTLGLTACANPPESSTPPPSSPAAPTSAPPPLTHGLPASVLTALGQAGLPEQALSAWVQGVDDTQAQMAHRADQPRLMASVMKLVTTGAALQMLGPTYTWQTDVALAGSLDAQGVLQGDVLVRASGDPSLDGTRLLSWLQQWRQAGLQDIRGNVRVDDTVFELPTLDPAAFDGENLKPYNATPRAWLLAHGAVSLQLRPDDARPGWARATLSPALAGVPVVANVKLSDAPACGDWRSALKLDVTAQAVTVSGRYAAACGEQSWPLLWPEQAAGEHSQRAWSAAWASLGGRHGGQVVQAPWPEPAPATWASWTSPPLSEVIRDINKFSNNVMARQLFLTLGRVQPDGSLRPSANLAQARGAVHAQVVSRTQALSPNACEGDALLLDNGSGLSRTESASAHCLGTWLMTLWQDPLMPEWLASLPIAGTDGTARRMQAVQGRAHLKTGSLDNVMAVAGVVQTPSGQRRVVVGVINHPQAELARPVMRALLEWAGADAP